MGFWMFNQGKNKIAESVEHAEKALDKNSAISALSAINIHSCGI
jgi:hypothetical protein